MPVVKSRLAEHVENKCHQLGFTITQRQLAEATGLRQATINKYLSDVSIERIDVEAVGKLARYFGIPFWEMLEVTEDPENETRSTPNAA